MLITVMEHLEWFICDGVNDEIGSLLRAKTNAINELGGYVASLRLRSHLLPGLCPQLRGGARES